MNYQPPQGETGAIAPVTLRDYQQAAVDAIAKAFIDFRRVLFVLPTGGGKTVTFSYLVHQARNNGKRCVVLAHRIEIIRQISRALTRQGVEHGIIAPGYAPTDHPVQVGMIQTIANRLDRLTEPHFLVEDECHHAVSGSYQKVRGRWRKALILGVTATPERLDGRGLGFAFDHMVIGPYPRTLIDAGALSDFIYLAPPTDDLDLSGVHIRGGDYATDELAAAVEKSTIYGNAIRHYGEYMGGKPALCFCISVRHAEVVAERFRRAGWRAASIDGSMGKLERNEILADLEHGNLDVLVSCDLVSEGFDVPAVQGAILLRPTKSLALFLQQVGRALRPKPDGSRAIILDHVGNVERHGLPDWERPWTLDGKIKRAPAAPVTVCELCFKAMPAEVPKSPDFTCAGVKDLETGLTLPCPYLIEKPKKPRAPFTEEVDGDLVEVTGRKPPAPDPMRPSWAGGLHLKDAAGRDWYRLLDLAGTDPERLDEIRMARLYRHGWVKHTLAARHAMEVDAGRIIDLGVTYWDRSGYTTAVIGQIEQATENVLWLVSRILHAKTADTYPTRAADKLTLSFVHAELNRRKQKAA